MKPSRTLRWPGDECGNTFVCIIYLTRALSFPSPSPCYCTFLACLPLRPTDRRISFRQSCGPWELVPAPDPRVLACMLVFNRTYVGPLGHLSELFHASHMYILLDVASPVMHSYVRLRPPVLWKWESLWILSMCTGRTGVMHPTHVHSGTYTPYPCAMGMLY